IPSCLYQTSNSGKPASEENCSCTIWSACIDIICSGKSSPEKFSTELTCGNDSIKTSSKAIQATTTIHFDLAPPIIFPHVSKVFFFIIKPLTLCYTKYIQQLYSYYKK